MSFDHLLVFNLALLAAIMSPGPALLIAVQTTLSAGRRAGMAVGAGLGLMAATWTAAALLGLEVVFAAAPWAVVLVKTAGAVYLIYVAFMMWRGARAPIAATPQPAHKAFRTGLMINILNPKSFLFSAAVLVVIFPADMSLLARSAVVVNHLAIELTFYVLLALAMSTPTVRAAYLGAKFYIDRCAAVVLGAVGLRLLFSRP